MKHFFLETIRYRDDDEWDFDIDLSDCGGVYGG